MSIINLTTLNFVTMTNLTFMKPTLYTFLILMITCSGLSSQSLEDDVNVKFMKAQVLFDAERYDEAARMYNGIINENDEYAPAYLMRAKSKEYLGAWSGVKKDIMAYIELNGVTKEVIKIMSNTEYEMGNYKAAKNYVTTALEMDPYDGDQLLIAGNIEMRSKNKTQACEQWEAAAQMGARGAKTLVAKECSVIFEMREIQREKKAEEKRKVKAKAQADAKRKADIAKRKREDQEKEAEETAEDSRSEVKSKTDKRPPIGIVPEEIEEETGNEDILNPIEEDAPNDSDIEKKKEKTKKEPKVEYEKVDMDAIQEIEIDEELSVIVGNGLGKRKVEDHPDIFMLSNDEGKVVIDICVDHEGKVYSAEIDKRKTTLFKTSLTSLALRKSKDFQFFPSFREEQCGFLIYVIKPGE